MKVPNQTSPPFSAVSRREMHCSSGQEGLEKAVANFRGAPAAETGQGSSASASGVTDLGDRSTVRENILTASRVTTTPRRGAAAAACKGISRDHRRVRAEMRRRPGRASTRLTNIQKIRRIEEIPGEGDRPSLQHDAATSN
jgi:hypothetical protein